MTLQRLVYRTTEAVREEVGAERMDVFTFGSNQGNSHVHWHVAPLPPGTPYDEQQGAAVGWSAGVLKIPEEEMAALAARIGRRVGGLQISEDQEGNGVPRLLARARSGRWLTLHGARTGPSRDHGSETVVVIEAAGPREVAWLKTSAYGLTKREREVVDLVARGASTRQISQALFISEHTVQEHLSNILEKVGERGRRALVKRLYLDSLS